MQADGSIGRVQVARRVVSIASYRSKKAVMPLVEELLRPLNSGTARPESTMALENFVEQHYLPHVASQKRLSTYKGYKNIWEVHLRPRCGRIRLRDFRTCDGERVLAEIARHKQLSRNTFSRIKSLLSGIFKHARRQGALDSINPMQDVSIPRGKPTVDTYAYSLEEVSRMVSVLPEPAATVVATAAFTGLRKGELQGLLWENYDGKQVRVTQAIWEGHAVEPKTKASTAPVPIIPRLATRLDGYRMAQGNPRSGLMFPSLRGTPLHFSNLVNYSIKPAVAKAGVEWHGWHAFRRGLATNLYRLGVPAKTIQAILRHSNVSTTLSCYVKSVSEDAAAAMQSLDEYAPTMHPFGGKPTERVV